MSQDRDRGDRTGWLQRVDELFARTLDLPAEEREAFLEREALKQPKLVQEVADLLAAAEEEDELLQSGGAGSAGLLDEVSSELGAHRPGDRVGRYRIEREIGRGGMGVVFLAERADGAYEQQVAIKLMRLGAGTEALARFTRERQILARLEHPNIARLLDGGVSDAGHPYLVVEHVAGEEILDYCDRKELSVHERLQLFCAVCEAIESAHRQLVVHRDIKPSNILVNEAGQVKLLDFGIAKLIEPEAGEGHLTQPGTTAMTPRYASPEQIGGMPVTVASDVYQLGILGYELLAGRRPYELEAGSAREAWEELAKLTAPPVSQLAAESDAPEVRGRARLLARDLDAVFSKALRQEPDRRYGSVDRLRADVERWLEGRPVQARPDSWGYRLRKFVGRHRAAVAVATIAVVTLVTLTAGFTWRLARERDQTALEAERARAALARAEELRAEGDEVLDFLQGLFEVSDPLENQGNPPTARELLDRGAETIEEELADQPAVRSRMLHTLGQLYGKLGTYDRAEELLTASRDLRAVDRGSRSYAESTATLGFHFYDTGDWTRARTLLEEAVALEEAQEEPDELALASALYRLAIVRGDSGEPVAADDLYHRALELYTKLKGPRSREVARVYNSLAINANWQGKAHEAAKLYGKALEILEEVYGPDDARLSGVINNLGLLSASLGRPKESVEYLERAVSLKEQVLSADHPNLADTRMNLAVAYLYTDQLEESDRQLTQAQETMRRIYAAKHPTFVNLEITLGRLRRMQERYEESLTHLNRAEALAVEVLGADHEWVAGSLNFRGKTLIRLGRHEEAIRDLEKSLALFEEMGNQYSHYDILMSLSESRLALDQPEEAERLLRRALETLEAKEGSPYQFAPVVERLTKLLRWQGREEEAAELERLYPREPEGATSE